MWTDGRRGREGNYRSETRLALPVGGRVAQWMSARGGYMYRSSRLYSKGVHSNQPNNHSLCYECCTRFDMIPGHKKRRPDLLLAFFFWVADNRVTYRRLAAAGNSLLEISRLGAPHEGHGSFLTGWGGTRVDGGRVDGRRGGREGACGRTDGRRGGAIIARKPGWRFPWGGE